MHAPLRKDADLAFQHGNYRLAIDLYRNSVANKEDGLVYTFLHLANAYIVEHGISGAAEVKDALVEVILYKGQDLEYFCKVFPALVFRIGAYYGVQALKNILKQAGMEQLDFYRGSGCVHIAGFPRCGTTSLALALVNAGIAVEPIIQEPFTDTFGILEISEAVELFKNSFWEWPTSASSTCQSKLFVDKSTHWLLSQVLLDALFSFAPSNSCFIVAVRDDIQRSLSAYSYNRNLTGSVASLSELIMKESFNIREMGGYRKIFCDAQAYLEFVKLLFKSNIRCSILYPSLVMRHMSDLYSTTHRSLMSLIDLERGIVKGRLLPEAINAALSFEAIPRVNSSIRCLVSSEEERLVEEALASLS